jgi:hypothetical protein
MTNNKTEFTSPQECVAAMQRLHKARGYGVFHRGPQEKQFQCAYCGKWKYKDERCNLFREKGTSR